MKPSRTEEADEKQIACESDVALLFRFFFVVPQTLFVSLFFRFPLPSPTSPSPRSFCSELRLGVSPLCVKTKPRQEKIFSKRGERERKRERGGEREEGRVLSLFLFRCRPSHLLLAPPPSLSLPSPPPSVLPSLSASLSTHPAVLE